jgi:hypothetical protein
MALVPAGGTLRGKKKEISLKPLRSNGCQKAVTAALVGVCFLTPGEYTNAAGLTDAQGWNGPGWYVTGSAPAQPKAAPVYILFEGPHVSQSDCVAVYDRLYSPIGICRYLNEKPGN